MSINQIPKGFARPQKGVWEMVYANMEMTSKTASMTCPDCGRLGSLYTHTIEPDGTVKPSVMCWAAHKELIPDGETTCSYHENIKLLGWEP